MADNDEQAHHAARLHRDQTDAAAKAAQQKVDDGKNTGNRALADEGRGERHDARHQGRRDGGEVQR
ncbi:hypothetical protein AB0E69_04655 [Kribbella sp. NPDC026611]|uniref:hypothetical protein n=1 Tax=Kribbella sp. NPDC026611 TaxID=3154911 RepID=UPI0033F14FB1